MAQAVYVVTSPVETGVTQGMRTLAGVSPPQVAAAQATSKPKVSPTQAGSIPAKESWPTDSNPQMQMTKNPFKVSIKKRYNPASHLGCLSSK